MGGVPWFPGGAVSVVVMGLGEEGWHGASCIVGVARARSHPLRSNVPLHCQRAQCAPKTCQRANVPKSCVAYSGLQQLQQPKANVSLSCSDVSHADYRLRQYCLEQSTIQCACGLLQTYTGMSWMLYWVKVGPSASCLKTVCR